MKVPAKQIRVALPHLKVGQESEITHISQKSSNAEVRGGAPPESSPKRPNDLPPHPLRPVRADHNVREGRHCLPTTSRVRMWGEAHGTCAPPRCETAAEPLLLSMEPNVLWDPEPVRDWKASRRKLLRSGKR